MGSTGLDGAGSWIHRALRWLWVTKYHLIIYKGSILFRKESLPSFKTVVLIQIILTNEEINNIIEKLNDTKVKEKDFEPTTGWTSYITFSDDKGNSQC